MSPNMIDTDSMPSRKANASTGCMWKVNGSISARVVGAEMPGRMPMTNPIRTPSINRGLIEGTVRPEGIDLVVITLHSPERHWRMMRGLEFDACELSLASYLLIRDQRSLPLTAIPVFPHRRFRHSY